MVSSYINLLYILSHDDSIAFSCWSVSEIRIKFQGGFTWAQRHEHHRGNDWDKGQKQAAATLDAKWQLESSYNTEASNRLELAIN